MDLTEHKRFVNMAKSWGKDNKAVIKCVQLMEDLVNYIESNRNLTEHDITEDDVDAIEDKIGMGCNAWDMVNTRELVAECVNIMLTKGK